jgi:hypothetical protein
MFETNEKFLAWSQATGLEDFSTPLVKNFSEKVVSEIRKLFIQHGRPIGPLDMLGLASSFGQVVAELVRLIRSVPISNQPFEQKAFVVEAIVALFRLIDGGVTGDEGRAQATASGGPGLPMFVSAQDMEEQFVRPLALRAYDEVARHLK